MNRTMWLQDRRMQKFRDVLSRWESKALSAMEAAEILGCSERQFRRYRARYEEDGLAGLLDRRLGKASARRVPTDAIAWMLEQYRTQYRDWNTPKAGKAVDKAQLTQVGLALKQLGIEHIPAYSPEARGRSERVFGTLQDRLAKELKLAGINDIASANRFIREIYLPGHNARFSRPPALPESAFVAADPVQLREILCIQHERIVARDNTVSHQRDRLQLPQSRLRAHYVKARVVLREYPDGTLAVFHGPRPIARYTSQGELIDSQPQQLAA